MKNSTLLQHIYRQFFCLMILMLQPAWFCASLYAAEPAKRLMILRVNNFTAIEYGACSGCGLLPNAQANSYARQGYASLDAIKKSLGGFDPAALFADSMQCLEFPGRERTCYDIVVLQGDQPFDQALRIRSEEEQQAGLVTMTLNISYLRRELHMAYTFSENASFGEMKPVKEFVFIYHEPAMEGLPISPFPSEIGGKLDVHGLAAHKYWFSPTLPVSPMKSAFIASLSEFRNDLQVLHPDLTAIDGNISQTERFAKLPLLGGLKAQGKINCSRKECKQSYLHQEGSRVCYFPETSTGVRFLRSVPLKSF